MKLTLTLVLTLISFAARTASPERIHTLVQNTLFTCGERIWPQTDWKAFEINLVSKTEAVQIVNGKLASLDPAKAGLRGKFRFEKNGITLNLDFFQSPQVAFEFMVHELFHAVGQKQLRALPSAQQDIYPANHLPRLEREELAQSLKAFISGEETTLKRVATWYYRHQVHHEDLSADLSEGSAEYVEAVASGLSKLGCGVSEEKLVSYALERITENGMPFDKSLEHYRIGALSFLALRTRGTSPVLALAQNQHPLTFLVTRSLIDPALSSDPLLEHSAEMITDLANRRNQEVIELLANSKNFAFVSFKDVAGSFEHRGSFLHQNTGYYEDLTVNTKGLLSVNGHAMQARACGATGFLVSVEAGVKAKKTELRRGARVYCL